MFKIKTFILVFILMLSFVKGNQQNCYDDYKNKIVRYSQQIPVYDYYFLLDNFQELTKLCEEAQETQTTKFNQSYRSKLDKIAS
jgi:hypothetical protein